MAHTGAGELRFLTLAELRERTPAEPTWLWHGYLATGSVTLLAGKPKAGKSTLAIAVSAAMATGATSFLGRDMRPGAVVYVSEEGAPTLMHKLPAGDAGMHLLTRDGAWPKPEWPALVNAAVEHSQKVGARLLVIDTAPFWTAMPAEGSKDGDRVQRVMHTLVQATRAGLAVLLTTHTRKAGGEDGDAVSGSTQWTGASDTVLELERPAENAPPTQRLLLGLGRFPATPAAALIDRDAVTGAWSVSGHAEDRRSARAAATRALVLDALADGEALTRPELEEATSTVWRDLLDTVNTLVTAKFVTRSGNGRKGDPYRYRKAVGDPTARNPTAPTETPRGGAGLSVVCPVGTPQKQAPPSSSADAVHAHRNGDLPAATDDEQRAYDEAMLLIEGASAA